MYICRYTHVGMYIHAEINAYNFTVQKIGKIF
jgi:hypothetical protein